MSEEQTRQLIARQRSALYGEGQFGEQPGYVDEMGAHRSGAPSVGGPSILRGQSPMTYDLNRGMPPPADGTTEAQATSIGAVGESTSRALSTASPQPTTAGSAAAVAAAAKAAFEGIGNNVSRTNASSPTDSTKHDHTPGLKLGQNPSVAPIGTRPLGAVPVVAPVAAITAPNGMASSAINLSSTPVVSPSWSRGNTSVWGQASGLGTQASVWG